MNGQRKYSKNREILVIIDMGGDEKRAIIRQSGRKLMTQISEPEDGLEQKKTEGNFI